MAAPVGVMDVGGSHVTAALVDPTAPSAVLLIHESPVDPHAERDVLLEQLTAPARAVLEAGGRPRGWSIAMPGPFDYAGGSGSFAGVDKFRSIAGVDLRSAFAGRLRARSDDVVFLNDAVAYGIGEWAAGAGGAVDRMVCVTLGTGVGSAFLDRGREVQAGETVPVAGEVHRLTIDGRPLEQTMSSAALRDAYSARTGRRAAVEEVFCVARSGDPAASEVVGTALRSLGEALGPWLQRFGAERLVVGGSIARSWDLVGPALRDGLAAGAPDADGVLVVPAALDGIAPLAGAAVAWQQHRGTDR